MGIVLASALGLVRFSFEASDLHDRARALLERGRHEGSARILKTLIADYPEELVRVEDGRFLCSVVAALETARALPAALEEEILSFAESEAGGLLVEVVPDDPALLERAAAYFPAPTAVRALHLLAILDLDVGRRAAAARRLRRVRLDPALASAAKARLRRTRWRPPPAPERMELAPKWLADVGGANAVVASGVLIVGSGYELAAVSLDSGEVLAHSGAGTALCAEGASVFVRRGARLSCLDARTLKERWRRHSQKTISACCDGERLFCVTEAAQGGELVCLDARAGAEQWKKAIRPGQVFCDGRRVFLMEDDGGLTAFDASSGRTIWAREGAGRKEALAGRRGKSPAEKSISAGMCSGLVVRTGVGLRPAAFDPLDGTEVWTNPREGALFAGEVCGLCVLRDEAVAALDPASGETRWKAGPGLLRGSRPVGWKGSVVFLSDGGLAAYGAEEGHGLEVASRHEVSLRGALLEAEGGIIAVDGKRAAFLCDARQELARLEALPRSAPDSIQIAEILRLLGRPEEALKHLEWIVEGEIRGETTRRRFVRALSRAGDALRSNPQLASLALEKALRLSRSREEKAFCLFSLSGLREAANEPAEAAALCQRVIEETPLVMQEYGGDLTAAASVVARHGIDLICRDHGWLAYEKIERKAAASGLDARGLYRRFPNSMEFCRRVAEKPEDRSLVAAALSSLRLRGDEESKRLASLLRSALGDGEEPQYSGLDRAWLVQTQDSLLRPGGRPGSDPPVLALDPQRTALSARDRVTGKLLWRASLPGRLLSSAWAGGTLVCLCTGSTRRVSAAPVGESVTALEARWGRLAWSRRLPARFRPVKTPVLLSDGEYIIAGNEFGAVVYDGRGGRVREIEGTVAAMEAGVAFAVKPFPPDARLGRLRAVELATGNALLEGHVRRGQFEVVERRVVFFAGGPAANRLRCVELPGGRIAWELDAPGADLAGAKDGLVVVNGPDASLVKHLTTEETLLTPERAQSWASSEGWFVFTLATGRGLAVAGIPFGKGRGWRKEYALPPASASLLRAGRDGVLLWCPAGGARGRAVLLGAATGEERGSFDLAGAEAEPVRYAESVWGRVRGGIVCLQLTPAPRGGPAPEDTRRLARKGGDEFFRRMEKRFRPGLSREELAELTRLLDAGRSGERPVARASRFHAEVDGDLSEWKDANWVEFSGIEHLWPDPLASSAPPTLSARAAVAWDDEGMYVAVEVADRTDAPGDAVEIHLLPRTGTRFRTLGKRLSERLVVRSRDAAARKTRYEWGMSWQALGAAEPKKKPGPRFRSPRDFDPERAQRTALIDVVVRDDGGWSLCLTGEALGAYDWRRFAEIEFGE